MTDLLEAQAEIRSRRQPIRDTSGQFIRPTKAVELQLAYERMKARLERDVRAAEHARGVVYEKGHFHALPNTDRLSVEHTAEVLPLFQRRAA